MRLKRILWGRLALWLLVVAMSWSITIVVNKLVYHLVPPWYGIFLGLIPAGLAALCFFLGEKRSGMYLLCCLLNAAACGVSIGVFYSQEQHEPGWSAMIMVSVCFWLFFVVLAACGGLAAGSRRGLASCGVAGVTALGILIFLLVVWWARSPTSIIHSYGFFTIIRCFVALATLLYCLHRQARRPVRAIAVGSFVSYIALTILVIIILTEGTLFARFA